jgi:hypothetical protein
VNLKLTYVVIVLVAVNRVLVTDIAIVLSLFVSFAGGVICEYLMAWQGMPSLCLHTWLAAYHITRPLRRSQP